MTKEQIKAVLDRVMTWPPDRQKDAVEMLLLLESQEGEMYHPSDDEWDAIQEGWQKRSEVNLSRKRKWNYSGSGLVHEGCRNAEGTARHCGGVSFR